MENHYYLEIILLLSYCYLTQIAHSEWEGVLIIAYVNSKQVLHCVNCCFSECITQAH